MAGIKVLIEITGTRRDGFAAFELAAANDVDGVRAAEQLVGPLAGLGVELDAMIAPIPMFAGSAGRSRGAAGAAPVAAALNDFSTAETNPDISATSVVVPAEVDRGKLADLQAQDNVQVWPNSEITFYPGQDLDTPPEADLTDLDRLGALFDRAPSQAGLDCRPFAPAVTVSTTRALLGVQKVWNDGFRGQNIIVGIIDEGVNGTVYPVIGGFAQLGLQQPGSAPITSHGSMCAADILVSAPAAQLFDYPFLGIPNSGGALAMFQAVLAQRRIDGTPHLTNNSYGFTGVPPQASAPHHEIWDIQHPIHRKVREVVASGAACFFAAGNCGANCPSGNCDVSGIGPGHSIHASNSLAEVITVAAVNSTHDRIGYSAQGPGMFEPLKPDLAAYSHFFGNFGAGRPGGQSGSLFDNGTSCASPVAAGVGALLLSAFPNLSPDALRAALLDGLISVTGPGWNRDYGRGIVNAAASYTRLVRPLI
jgi:serine protease AprX